MDEATQRRFIDLLAPIHDRARETARRLELQAGDGDDLFQEAVLRACQKLSSLRDPAKFPMWFHRILLNVHRNRSRRAFWKRFVPLDASEPGEQEVVGEEGGLREEQYHRAERLARALATLPAVQREAIVLFDIQGYAVEEIAAMQKATPSAVKSRLVRGRDRLRQHYQKVLGVRTTRAPGSQTVAREEGETT